MKRQKNQNSCVEPRAKGNPVNEKVVLEEAIAKLVDSLTARQLAPRDTTDQLDIQICRDARFALTAFVDYRAWSGDQPLVVKALGEDLKSHLSDGAELLGITSKYGQSVEQKFRFLTNLLDGASFESLVEVALT